MAEKINLYMAECRAWSGFTVTEDMAWDTLVQILGESRVEDLQNEIHNYEAHLIETYKDVKIYHSDEVGTICELEGDGYFHEYASVADAKKDIDLLKEHFLTSEWRETYMPNPEMLTDLWQRKWWF